MGRTGLSTQFNTGEELVAYGTQAAAIGRSTEIVSEDISDSFERIESEALRASRRVTQQWRPNRKGAEGDVEYEVASKGFGRTFKHMLGAIATSQPDAVGAPTVYEHVATLGDLNGDSLTVQAGRPDVGGTVRPFTYLGGKVASWELSQEVDGVLRLTNGMDFMSSTTATALATAQYPSGLTLLDFTGTTITVAGAQYDASSVSLSCENNLKTDRYFLRGSSLKKEPLEDTAPRDITGDVPGEFESLAVYNRLVDGTEFALVQTFAGDTITGAHRFAVVVSAPRCRVDSATPTAGGPDVLEQPHEFKVLAPTDGSSPVTITYRTTDAAA